MNQYDFIFFKKMEIPHQKVSKAYGDDCALMFDMHNCLADRLSNK